MEYFLVIVPLGIVVACFWRTYWYKKVLEELADAIESRKGCLLDSERVARSRVWSRIYLGLNMIFEDFRKLELAAQSEMHQIDMTLGQLQEAVIMVDHSGRIVSLNLAAARLFGIVKEEKMKSIYPYIKSSDFFDYMMHVKEGGAQSQREISIDKDAKKLWFEVSGICLQTGTHAGQNTALVNDRVYLFVLHDITRLKDLENIRREFVANVSHELRTPVTIIKGFTDTLLNDHRKLGAVDREKFLQKIHKNVDRFHMLLEDLLSLSRLESDKVTLNRREISVQTLFDDAWEQVRHRIQPGLKMTVEIDPSVPVVWVDELKFSQILNNVLDNIFRYAKTFTEIRMKTRREGTLLWFSIEDDGQGIPEVDLPHLFERFYRVDKGRSRENGGTGLGLSIVKHIVLMHGGEVRAESEQRKGTRIVFSIPLKRG